MKLLYICIIMVTLNFISQKKVSWISKVCEFRALAPNKGEDILFTFSGLEPQETAPEHVATLACLIEHFASKGHNVLIDQSPLGIFLWEQCQLRQYWGGRQNYSVSPDQKILNLWRVNMEEKDFRGTQVADYLRNHFFKHKDLTAVGNSLTEAYYNIFDHAEAQGNAFSMLMYDESKEVLHVAVCDFGIGIAKTVKDFLGEDMSDSEAISRAIQTNFSVKSKNHNAGWGLQNIISCCTDDDTLWIISNKGSLVVSNGEARNYDLGFAFNGTLLFYSISLSHFEDEEIINDFNL